ncbi:hypothetical protein Cantr_05785 [Candida viswanathii]|uniref:Uncharacterized protein n=1 Tax=Candida viswanathii TaxID=5486 RepID=A0A367XR88_9ASCO|nr:hypothetical protein Cantr_05785 [Candida viswanathii]
MFSQSGTQTPVPSSQHGNQLQKIQFHEVLGETVTWVNDWYLPNLSNSPSRHIDTTTAATTGAAAAAAAAAVLSQAGLAEDDSATPAISDSIRLKGWHKTNINHKQSSNVLNPNDILDLSKWKYFKDPVAETEEDKTSNGAEITEVKKEEHVVGGGSGGVLGEVISF